MQTSAFTSPLDPITSLAIGGIERVASITSTVLREYGIQGSMFSASEIADLREQERLLTEGIIFRFDPAKSIAANLADLFAQAAEIQKNSGGANYVGAMLQHLVGAKLDIVLGSGIIKHHGYSVADEPTSRQADFEVNGVALHVTTYPMDALIQKAAANLKSGLKPVIVTLADGVEGAAYLLKSTEWRDRVDVIDATQFLTANIYERSLFKAGDCKATITSILGRYNEIVEQCETDPVLRIRC